MITREQFIAAYAHEMHCVRHLATKVTQDMLEYRPTEPQRSMLELMQYLSFASLGMADSIVTTKEKFGIHKATSESVTLDTFQDAMHHQEAALKELFAGITDEQLAEEVDFYGVRTRAGHLMAHLQMLTAYKMQFFLYIKSCGVSTIGTMDLWAGMDTPPKMD